MREIGEPFGLRGVGGIENVGKQGEKKNKGKYKEKGTEWRAHEKIASRSDGRKSYWNVKKLVK